MFIGIQGPLFFHASKHHNINYSCWNNMLTKKKEVYGKHLVLKDDMLYQCHKRSVDVITGSTTNSKCLMKAVENALANRTQLK